MDVVAAYRAFLHVSERESFTQGAAAARIPQPVASRRIAALEKRLGERLLDRSGRRVTLTPFGRAMLPSAERLVGLVDAMDYDAETARRGPIRVAVPDVCAVRDLASLVAEAKTAGFNLELRPAAPSARSELTQRLPVEAAITAVPASEGRWSVPLGLAGRTADGADVVYVETLRPSRADQRSHRPRIWVQPEDDLPHIADHLRRLGDSTGLQPSQVAVASSLISATGAVLSSTDLLLCSSRQADDLRLHWRPVGEMAFRRSYTVIGTPTTVQQLTRVLEQAVARCLGAQPAGLGAP